MDLMDPFLTYFREHPDFNSQDSRNEAQALIERQDVIERFVAGELPVDAVLETLLEQGISPDAYIDAVEENVDYVINSGVTFTSNDAGIYLPTFR